MEKYLIERSNWGRWGPSDQLGTINLITPAKRMMAARLVRSGISVNMGRPLSTQPTRDNPLPAQHFTIKRTLPSKGEGVGTAGDYYGMVPHGLSMTHIDALSHLWDRAGMYNGRDPNVEITFEGARSGGIEHWRKGIVTRGVLLDVPAFRREPYVTHDQPVHGSELREIARSQGINVEPGDALVVYCGREKYTSDMGGYDVDQGLAGLHTSCLQFLRDTDCSVLVWDMVDVSPIPYGLAFGVHYGLISFGLALVDNALVEPLAVACAEAGRYEFMLVVAPLVITGGTSSPVNPLAIL